MRRLRRRIVGSLAAKLMARFEKKVSRMTPVGAERFGRKLGRRLYRWMPSRRARALDNLRLAFPEKSFADIESIAKQCFENFALRGVEFLRSRGRTLDDLLATTEVVGFEHLQEASSRGVGVIAVTGHIGDFERIHAFSSLSGYPSSVVYRDAEQDGVNSIVNALRGDSGTKIIPRGNAARPIMEALKRNELVGILPDQNADDIFIPFFGHPAGTVLGPGVIAERTKTPVIPVYCIALGGGKFRLVFGEELKPKPGYAVKGEGMMRAVNDWLESVIREYPDQWLWFHDRWRNARKQGLL